MTDPLGSWRDGEAKRAITDYLARVCDSASEAFVPAPERVAVFDNDGTLWCERPGFVQAYFVIERLQKLCGG
jgi:hypothetical protein